MAKTILLIDEAMTLAAEKLQVVSTDMNTLEYDLEQALNKLKVGFDTDAGHKFMSACESQLLQPMKDQVLVIEHVSSNLNAARDKYASVFAKYKALINKLKSYKY